MRTPCGGLFVPNVWLGDQVTRGTKVAEIWATTGGGYTVTPIVANIEDTVVAIARRGVVQPDESLTFIAEPLQR